jgi:hypothetical protein
MAKLENVFGVNSKTVLSYVERDDVDNSFKEALASGKQVVVYGSSKQGKTALVSKYLPYDNNILISLTPRTQVIDIYQAILNKAGVRIITGLTEKNGTESSLSVTAKFKAMVPLFGSATAETGGNTRANSGTEVKYEEIQVNIELPQTVADLLTQARCSKWIVLENFHYLEDDLQRRFAFDLRAFQELGVKFVILGVWREKNRMAQFNGDLLDRTIEVPVEPWLEIDFRRVVEKGAAELNLSFDANLIEDVIEASFSSIGVFQELIKHICIRAGVKNHQSDRIIISDKQYLKDAIQIKTNDYAARHERALEAISAGYTSGGTKKGELPLYLPYYLVQSILKHGFEGIANGAIRASLHDWIRENHHRRDDVRASDMTNLLGGLANLQSVKSISPPIFAYDEQLRTLQVVDSTFYFFIKHVDITRVSESIQNPLN